MVSCFLFWSHFISIFCIIAANFQASFPFVQNGRYPLQLFSDSSILECCVRFLRYPLGAQSRPCHLVHSLVHSVFTYRLRLLLHLPLCSSLFWVYCLLICLLFDQDFFYIALLVLFFSCLRFVGKFDWQVNEEILVDKHEGWWRIIHEGFSFMENAFMGNSLDFFGR